MGMKETDLASLVTDKACRRAATAQASALPQRIFFPQSWLAFQVRIFASNIPIKRAYRIHVLGHVTARLHEFPQTAQLSFVIQITQADRHTSLIGNVIEARPPRVYPLSGTFRRHR